MGEGLLLALERQLATDFLQVGEYSSFRLASLTLPTTTAAATPLLLLSFHNSNGEEERLTLTPCASQLYVLPTGVQQVILWNLVAWVSFGTPPILCHKYHSFLCRCPLT